MSHLPVLLREVLKYLDPKPNQNFVDATLGEAGHTMAILEKNGPNGKVLGIERDPEIFEDTKYKILNTKYKNRLIPVNDNFVNLKNIIEGYNFKPINGILFDLGMSSWHIEESGRGFSFRKDEPLDMRYSREGDISECRLQVKGYQNQELTAEKIVNYWPKKEIERIFREYGEERFSRRITERICEKRKEEPIKTTFQLIKIIGSAFPRKYKFGKAHFATRVFQALRIAVNDELENLKKVLPQVLEILEPRGRIAVISFHSLEDRIVKHFFKDQTKLHRLEIITKKPIRPTWDEIQQNPRSRSAKLRTAVKV